MIQRSLTRRNCNEAMHCCRPEGALTQARRISHVSLGHPYPDESLRAELEQALLRDSRRAVNAFSVCTQTQVDRRYPFFFFTLSTQSTTSAGLHTFVQKNVTSFLGTRASKNVRCEKVFCKTLGKISTLYQRF